VRKSLEKNAFEVILSPAKIRLTETRARGMGFFWTNRHNPKYNHINKILIKDNAAGKDEIKETNNKQNNSNQLTNKVYKKTSSISINIQTINLKNQINQNWNDKRISKNDIN
jgi:hypothetical protein